MVNNSKENSNDHLAYMNHAIIQAATMSADILISRAKKNEDVS